MTRLNARGVRRSLRWMGLFALLSVALAASGCKKAEKEAPSAKASASVSETKKEHKPKKPRAPLEPPVLEDFEDRAERRITADNLETELDKLEKELSAD
jgi:hypothetical protein